MSEESFNLQDLFANTVVADNAHAADLWPRIAAAHEKRSRRRRTLRFTGAGLVVMFVFGLLVFSPWRLMTQQSAAAVDWQARAQALELQIDALPMPSPGESAHALDTVSQIGHVDGDLQSAYDRGASHDAILPLWKRRSELLGALLAERQQHPIITDI